MTTPAIAVENEAGTRIIAAGAPADEQPLFRILVIDDTPAIHQDFRKILTRAETPALDEARAAFFGPSLPRCRQVSFALDSAYQGQEGLALVERAVKDDRPYALAFVDIRMPPGWDGVETISRLWAADPDLQVVICTAFSDYSWDQVSDRFGRTDSLLILKKPFDNVEALQVAHTLTRKWLLTRQARSRMADLDKRVNQRTNDLRTLNDRLVAEMAERKEAQVRLAAFSALGQRLSAAPTARAAGQVIVEVADQLLGWDACLLDLYSPAEDILSHVLRADLLNGRRTECSPKDDRSQPIGLARRAINEGGQLILKQDATRTHPGSVAFGDTSRPSASLMFVPVRNGKIVTGVLSIQSYTANAYNPRSLETLQTLADLCGGALDRIRTEEARRASEERYRSLFANMVEGVAYCRMVFEQDQPQDFVYLSVNDALERLTGLKGVVGKKVTEVIPGIRESHPEIFEIYGRVSRTGQPERFERYFPSLRLWLAVTAYSTEKGFFTAVFDNVTERKRAELRLSAFSTLGQRLSAAQTAREAARIIVDVADQLIGWDACTCSLYRPNESLMTNLLDVDIIEGKRTECAPIHDRITPTPTIKRAMEEGGQLILREPAEIARRNSLPFGNPARRSASLMFVPVRNGPSVIGVISIQSYAHNAYDRSSLETLQTLADHCAGALERIRAQEARNESEERYRLSEAQLRQSQKMEAIGHLAGGVAHDFNNLLAVIRGNTELVLMNADQLSRGASDGLKQVIMAADRAANLTRQLLAFSRKNVMQSRPLDLNEVIGNFTKMLRRIIGENIRLSCNYAARLPSVQADVGMLEQVLVNLAVNARDAMPKGGRLLITTETVSSDAAAASAHPEAGGSGQYHHPLPGISLSPLAERESGRGARTPEDQWIGQAWEPGASSLQASPPEEERELSQSRGGNGKIGPPEANAGDFVCMSVTDTGTGIAGEHLPHIFEPFFTTKEVGKGTGLGLATVYGIVQQHQGWIEVVSEPGAGATFKIFLPAIELSAAPVSAAGPVETRPVGGSETVLLVEDDEAVRAVTRLLLRNFGYRVYEASSGLEAIELWRAHKGEITLLLTDMIMPGRMNGRELAEQLLADQPALNVILMTGYSGDTVNEDTAFLRRTRTRFLQKPCDSQALLKTVRECLDGKSNT